MWYEGLNPVFYHLKKKQVKIKIQNRYNNYTHGVFYTYREAWLLSFETYNNCIIRVFSTKKSDTIDIQGLWDT